MNNLCTEAVALDSNVFIHLLNKKHNTGGHIDKLLQGLADDKLSLLVDAHGHIAQEYFDHVIPMIANADDIGPQTQILRYWMAPERRITVEVLKNGPLWQSVLGVIHEPQEVEDRCFVCIAFTKGKALVTNDSMHILVGPTRELGGPRGSTRKTRLRRIARNEGLIGILCNTLEASQQL